MRLIGLLAVFPAPGEIIIDRFAESLLRLTERLSLKGDDIPRVDEIRALFSLRFGLRQYRDAAMKESAHSIALSYARAAPPESFAHGAIRDLASARTETGDAAACAFRCFYHFFLP